MLWELGEYIKNKIKMTVIPALKNLFSSKRSLAGMLLVMLILQVLLSVICITGIENIKNQQIVLNNYTQIISSSNIADAGSNMFLSENTEVAFSSISIFIGALLIWGICALTVYQKLTFSSADRDKYVWGMYVTHGAKVKKIRSMLRYELYLPHMVATVIGYPIALGLCNLSFKRLGYAYSFSLISVIAVIVLSYVCIRLVMEYQCFLIRRMSCVQMLKEEDAPGRVCLPRRHSRLIRGFTSERYASVTFIRMRKYYISLAAIAAIPAVIWVCFQVSAKGEDAYLASEINEFDVTIDAGITEEKLNTIDKVHISKINGVNSIKAEACYPANEIYTHLLLDGKYFKNTALTPHHTNLYADNDLVLCCYDTAFRQHVGHISGRVRDGYVTVVRSPADCDYNYKDDDKIWLAVSKLDGSTRVVDQSNIDLLKNEIDDCEYLEFSIGSVKVLGEGELTANGFSNPDKTYFLLSPADYKRVTSIVPESYSCEIDALSVSYTTTLDNKGRFTLSADRSLFTVLPNVGDCLEIYGTFKANAKLKEITDGKIPPQTWTQNIDQKFQYLYISSVSVNSDTVTLTVSPYAVINVHDGLFWDVLLAFGTPELASSSLNYFASTCSENLTLTNTSVSLTGDIVTVHTSSAVGAAEAGTHALVTTDVLTTTDDRLLLERLYADSSFKIACADTRTKNALGLDIPYVGREQAVLVLPASGNHNYALSVGDKLRISIAKSDVAKYDPTSFSTIPEFDVLTQLLDRLVHDYVLCNISHVIFSENVSGPVIFVNPEEYCVIIDKQAPHVSFDIIIDAGIDSVDYGDLRKSISDWASSNNTPTEVISKGSYADYLLRKTANYATIMILIGTLVPLIIPFIWYYPISALFDRRRTELQLLRALGKKRSQIFKSFAIEGAIVSASAFASVVLFCYPALFVFSILCAICGLPMTLEVGKLTPLFMLAAAAFSALCAAISFVICFIMTTPKKQGTPK